MTATIDDIDNALPQTQCGQCGFSGCQPYAKALSEAKTTIDLCPPGGKAGVTKLAELLEIDPKSYLENFVEEPLTKVTIEEDACIGCAKCLNACPVDAIVGRAQRIHTVLMDQCTGCDLCIPACPVDCIKVIPSKDKHDPKQAKTRYLAKQQRQQNQLNQQSQTYQTHTFQDQADALAARKAEIQAAIERVKQK